MCTNYRYVCSIIMTLNVVIVHSSPLTLATQLLKHIPAILFVPHDKGPTIPNQSPYKIPLYVGSPIFKISAIYYYANNFYFAPDPHLLIYRCIRIFAPYYVSIAKQWSKILRRCCECLKYFFCLQRNLTAAYNKLKFFFTFYFLVKPPC